MLFVRALLAFLLLPGIVAFAVPLWIAWPPGRRVLHVVAVPLFALGAGLLWWCVREFFVAGKGTLAPWDPPRHLVTSGPYRVSRNPMYLAVTLILIGWAAAFQMRALWYYALVVVAAFHARVVLAEEPWAKRMFGNEWRRYCERVPRWLF